jgi:hypothetical protein
MNLYSEREKADMVAMDPEGGRNAAQIVRQAETFAVETPDAPAWVAKNQAAQYMWTTDLGWRCNAANATTAQYKRHLIAEATRVRAFRGR